MREGAELDKASMEEVIGVTAAGSPRALLTLDDYAQAARRSMEPAVWDFIEGGAGDERSLRANVSAYDRIALRPRVLTGVHDVDTSVSVFGRSWAAPIGIAPLAFHTIAHPDGEMATVRAAGSAGLPVVVSTFAGREFGELGTAATAPLWLQVYCFRDRTVTREVIERAERAGFEALVLTVDTPYLGRRLRDVRNSFRLPRGVRPANIPGADFSSPSAHARAELDSHLDWSVVEWLRSVSRLPIVLKGILTPEDAVLALGAGVDGIVVSNHGGRQFAGAPAALDLLPDIAAAVDHRCPVLVDGGIRRGTDVLAALASGADAVLVGRPVLHSLAIGGSPSVSDMLQVLLDELTDAMVFTGVESVDRVGAELVAGHGRFEISQPAVSHRTHRERACDGDGALRKEALHGSLVDPLLESMNFLNEVTGRYPQAISFAPGRPFEGFFDTEDVFVNIRRYLSHLEDQGLTKEQIRNVMYQYGPTAGNIQEIIADSLRVDEGISVDPRCIVVTAGCQEAMFLSLRAIFSDADDVLLVAAPCYVGIAGAARLLDISVVGVDERDGEGIRSADVEAVILEQLARGKRPRAFYLVPDHSNPSGNTIDPPERRALVEMAARHDVLILEDSPYRSVSVGVRHPTLKALDHECRVVHLGSYAKSAFPGARIGFVIADQQVRDETRRTTVLADEIAKIKSMVTVNTSPLGQAAVAGMLLGAGGRLSEATAAMSEHYGEALRTTLEALECHLPPRHREELGVHWNTPTGGFFLTLQTRFRADMDAMRRSAEQFGVIWTPMSYFHPGGGGDQAIRLSFSYLSPPDIELGIARLANFLEAETARADTPACPDAYRRPVAKAMGAVGASSAVGSQID